MVEPRIHSHVTDVLPEDHPRAYDSIYCKRCDAMLHCSNNECMCTWVETGSGNYCLECFSILVKGPFFDKFEMGLDR